MVALYHALEVLPGLLVQAIGFQGADVLALLFLSLNLLFLCTHLSIDLDVKFEEMINRVLLQSFFVTVALVGQSK